MEAEAIEPLDLEITTSDEHSSTHYFQSTVIVPDLLHFALKDNPRIYSVSTNIATTTTELCQAHRVQDRKVLYFSPYLTPEFLG